jgi:hypothetical protein
MRHTRILTVCFGIVALVAATFAMIFSSATHSELHDNVSIDARMSDAATAKVTGRNQMSWKSKSRQSDRSFAPR